MKIEIPAQIAVAMTILEDAGHEAFLVGGCVRDALRGVSPHDFDMATSALPEQTCRLFSGYRTIETGLRHGTLTVLIEGMPIEITTYRVDGVYADHRRPEQVTFTPSLTEDLARRDFTVNAMAYSPRDGLVDPFGGQEDLAAGVIRAVGDPVRRFSEDALRILRALRFSARFGFSIEGETAAAAHALAGTLEKIAPERVREELYGILVADFAEAVISQYRGILSGIIPEGNAGARLASLPPELPLRLAEYFLEEREKADGALRRLRADNQTIRTVTSLLRLYDCEIEATHAALCRLLRTAPPGILRSAFALRALHGRDDRIAAEKMEEILASGACYTVSMLAVSGDDVAALGIPRGPMLGRTLEDAYTAVIEGCIPNEREALLRYLAKKAT